MARSLYIGRFQPFHDGHRACIDALLAEGRGVLVAIRDTPTSSENPYTPTARWAMIRSAYPETERVQIILIPDIDEVAYGRTPGWSIREIKVSPEIAAISATEIRAGA